MNKKQAQDSGEDKVRQETTEAHGPSRRQFLVQTGRVAAGVSAASSAAMVCGSRSPASLRIMSASSAARAS